MKIERPEDADFLVQKIPCDMGIHRNPRKGTLSGPEKIMNDFDTDFSVFVDEVFPDEFSLEETHSRIFENTEELIEYDRSLISIGGDHSISYPLIRALKKKHPDMKLVWLDAHLDLKEKVKDHVSHDVVVRELIEEGIFESDEVVFVGITEIDHDEKKFLEKHDIKIYRPEEISLFLEEHDSKEACYLSIDIDVLDKDEAPGTGYKDGQMSLMEVEKVIEKVRPENADIVEVAPPFDVNGRTVENARKLLDKLLEANTK